MPVNAMFRLCATTLLVATGALVLASAPSPVQTGDQILDGIGETGVLARYVLDTSVEDSSRNQAHAELRGTGVFVDDAQFQRALLLTGDGSHVQLPGGVLSGEDTLSVSAWLFLPTGASGPVFDFGQSASTRFVATAAASGVRTSVAVAGAMRGEARTPAVREN